MRLKENMKIEVIKINCDLIASVNRAVSVHRSMGGQEVRE